MDQVTAVSSRHSPEANQRRLEAAATTVMETYEMAHVDQTSSDLPHELIADLCQAQAQGLYRSRRRLASAQGARARWQGQEYLNFTTNDYLSLAADVRLARAAARAARRYGTGAGASPLISGYLPPLRRLERCLAAWERSSGAVVFSSGFAANLGLITALAGPDDVIFSDALNHASLIDGCRLSRAFVNVYQHVDVNHLKELLSRKAKQGRRRLIVTESVFSMDGDWAPLPDLLDLARRYDALLLIDEAHASGVLGAHGRGLVEVLLPELSSDDATVIKVGTLSKALGSQGGFVCGGRILIDWLVNQSRPYIYSTALAPPAAAAARRAVGIVQEEPIRRQRLFALGDLLRTRLRKAGLPETNSRCHIVPVIVGDATAAMNLSCHLADQGILVPAIRPPSVPDGTARLRISLTSGHCEEDVERLVAQLQKLFVGSPVR
jgi:8-amino-7-oxononanoate synthase